MKTLIPLSFLIFLSACGGGGGSSDSPTTSRQDNPVTEERSEAIAAKSAMLSRLWENLHALAGSPWNERTHRSQWTQFRRGIQLGKYLQYKDPQGSHEEMELILTEFSQAKSREGVPDFKVLAKRISKEIRK